MTRQEAMKRIQDLVDDIQLYFEGDECVELLEEMSEHASAAMEAMDEDEPDVDLEDEDEDDEDLDVDDEEELDEEEE